MSEAPHTPAIRRQTTGKGCVGPHRNVGFMSRSGPNSARGFADVLSACGDVGGNRMWWRSAELSAGLLMLMRRRWCIPARLPVHLLIAACAIALAPVDAWALTGTSTAVTGGSSVVGQSASFTATVTPLGAGTPTGTVTFNFGDGSPTSVVALNVSDQAAASHAYAVLGTYTVTATCQIGTRTSPSAWDRTHRSLLRPRPARLCCPLRARACSAKR